MDIKNLLSFKKIYDLDEYSLIDEDLQIVFTGFPNDPYKFAAYNLSTEETHVAKSMAPFVDIKIMKLSFHGKMLAYFVKTACGLAIFSCDYSFSLGRPFSCKLACTDPHVVDFFWSGDHSLLIVHQLGLELHSVKEKHTKLIDQIQFKVYHVDYLAKENLACFAYLTGSVHVVKVTKTSLVPYMQFTLDDLSSPPNICLVNLYNTPYLFLLPFNPSKTILLYEVVSQKILPRPKRLSMNSYVNLSSVTVVDNLLILYSDSSFNVFDVCDTCSSPVFSSLRADSPGSLQIYHHSNICTTESQIFSIQFDLNLSYLLQSPLYTCSFILRRSKNLEIFLDFFERIVHIDDLSLLSQLFSLIYDRKDSPEYTVDDLYHVITTTFVKVPHHINLLHIRWTRSKDTYAAVSLLRSLLKEGRYSAVSQYVSVLPKSLSMARLLIESGKFFSDGIEILTKFSSSNPFNVFSELKSESFDFNLLKPIIDNRGEHIVHIDGVDYPISTNFRKFLDIICQYWILM